SRTGNDPQPRRYRYDANGNMSNADGLVCTWDFEDRLVAVENDSMRAEYRYDFSDRRVSKRVQWKPGAAVPPAAGADNEGLTTTVYPGTHFEVREHDQPTKYVFDGATLVASITGSLSASARVQRVRLSPGWNLVSLAVTAANLADQLQHSSSAAVDA